MADNDRRSFPRYQISVDATVTTAEYTLPVTATELSLGGLRIHSAKALYPGDAVRVTLRLPEKTAIRGHVVWVLDCHTDEGLHFYQIGVESDAMIHGNQSAVGLTERTLVLQEVLFSIKRQEEIEGE